MRPLPNPHGIPGAIKFSAADRRATRDANDDAQVRLRRVLRLLNAAHGSVIHDLTVVIDGGADIEVCSAADEARGRLEDLIAGMQSAVKDAVDVCGCEILEPAARVAVAVE